MASEALIMARLQLKYWQEQYDVAQKAGDAELVAQTKLYLEDAQAELAALEPPGDGDPSDSRSIDLFDEAEVRAYCHEFGVTEEDLTTAVNVAGVRVGDVKQYLLRLEIRRSFNRR